MTDLFDDEPLAEDEIRGYQERLDTAARRLVDKRKDRDAKAKAAEVAEKAFKREQRNVWDLMLDMKQSNATLLLGEGYGKVQLVQRETVTASVLNEEVLREALAEEGRDEAIFDEGRPKIRKKVLNQLIRDREKANQPLPAGVTRHANQYVTMTFDK